MKRLDLPLLFSVLFLCFFGLFMIYDASSFVAYRDFQDKYQYVKDQSMWLVLGIIALFVMSYFDYKKLYLFAIPGMIVSIILLLLVFIPGLGISALGARRWINFGLFVMQPAEFVKLSLAIYLSAWFSQKEKGRLLPFLLLIGFVLGLIMLEPDMGTAFIVLSSAMILYFLSGGPVVHFLGIIPIVAIIGFILIKIEPYRAARLATFLNPNQSLETSSYHVRQILIALGSGGIFGVGLGNSLQKFAYLPENTTDSIFAIIGEELGLIGASIIICIYMVIVWRGFTIAIRSKDAFGKLLAGTITSYVAMQTFINLAAQTHLLPLTGIPLPFISYGGSALIVTMASMGILLNISRHNNKEK